MYHEVKNVDKALKKQLVKALEPMYLDEVRDRTTDTIIIPVHEVLEHLFDTYGDISPETFVQILH